MQKGLLRSLLAIGAATLFTFSSCTTKSTLGEDNDSVIKTPYSLFAAKSDGTIIQSTTGESFNFIFPPDGYGPTQIVTSGNNLMIVKDYLHMSTNDGQSFNPVFTKLRKFNWQSMIYNHVPFGKVFVTSTEGRGVFFSKDNGVTWEEDIFIAGLPNLYQVSSFAGLDNGNLYAYSNVSNITFVKTGPNIEWTPVTTISFTPVAGAEFFLISAGNTLFMVDYNGIGGVWYSVDGAVHWERLDGNQILPYNSTWTCAASSFGGKNIVVGTKNHGIFRSDENGLFQKASGGLLSNTEVYSMTKKINVYKNNTVKTYLYAATSTGIYRSEDTGNTWYLVGEDHWTGDYISIY